MTGIDRSWLFVWIGIVMLGCGSAQAARNMHERFDRYLAAHPQPRSGCGRHVAITAGYTIDNTPVELMYGYVPVGRLNASARKIDVGRMLRDYLRLRVAPEMAGLGEDPSLAAYPHRFVIKLENFEFREHVVQLDLLVSYFHGGRLAFKNNYRSVSSKPVDTIFRSGLAAERKGLHQAMAAALDKIWNRVMEDLGKSSR
ncbi:hypothetical protein JW905_12155 [bacterium]|nr:hypothetical protein [candidate division CSSED10-310 bacterium]